MSDQARRAGPADAGELVRLRAVMLAGVSARHPGGTGDDGWRAAAAAVLRDRLAAPEPVMAAFVVPRPGGGLAACAVGTLEQRLPGPGNPGGLIGYVFSVATDPPLRRRGYARACVVALLDWFAAREVRVVDLRTSPEAEGLYASLGFVRTPDPAMRLRR